MEPIKIVVIVVIVLVAFYVIMWAIRQITGTAWGNLACKATMGAFKIPTFGVPNIFDILRLNPGNMICDLIMPF